MTRKMVCTSHEKANSMFGNGCTLTMYEAMNTNWPIFSLLQHMCEYQGTVVMMLPREICNSAVAI